MKNVLFLVLSLWIGNVQAAEFSDERIIGMASEGAPKHITSGASFMKFEAGKFRSIKKGKNNFTCVIISDPNGRYEPSCFNEEAMRSVFPSYELNMKLLYEGKTYEFANKELMKEFEKGRLPSAEHGALVYMMSPNNRGFNPNTKILKSTPIHQMYFYPKLSDETFSLSGERVFLWQGFPHLSALIVVVNEVTP